MRFHEQRFISLNKFYSIWFLAKIHLSQKFLFVKTVRLKEIKNFRKLKDLNENAQTQGKDMQS